jgi:uncharacterized protein (TIGR03086 family)
MGMTMTATIDEITALERSYDTLTAVVHQLEEHSLDQPTNCPEWDVRALLNHILGGALMYIGANNGEQRSEDAGYVVGDDPSGAVAAIAAANLASWRSPGALDGERVYPWGTFPAAVGLLINAGEVALHAWDLAKATGQAATIDTNVAEVVYDFYRHVPMDDMRAKGVYGPEIDIAETAPIQQRLLGFLNRQ